MRVVLPCGRLRRASWQGLSFLLRLPFFLTGRRAVLEEIEAQGSQRGRSGVASLLDRPLVHVLRLFTSFGYFDDLAEHVTVVRNIARSLKPGGSVVLDYLNVHHADRHLTPEDVTERDGIVYRLTRWTDAH